MQEIFCYSDLIAGKNLQNFGRKKLIISLLTGNKGSQKQLD